MHNAVSDSISQIIFFFIIFFGFGKESLYFFLILFLSLRARGALYHLDIFYKTRLTRPQTNMGYISKIYKSVINSLCTVLLN